MQGSMIVASTPVKFILAVNVFVLLYLRNRKEGGIYMVAHKISMDSILRKSPAIASNFKKHF
jgi:hypothetical protein